MATDTDTAAERRAVRDALVDALGHRTEATITLSDLAAMAGHSPAACERVMGHLETRGPLTVERTGGCGTAVRWRVTRPD